MYHAAVRPAKGVQRKSRVLGRPEALARFPWLEDAVWRAADRVFPVRVPRAWAEAMDPEDPEDPLALQALPQRRELERAEGDLVDPVGEVGLQPVPWVVRKHPDRVLLLTTRRCHLYCRYCFRRNQHEGPEDPSPEELERALDYCRHSGARELILSGGDPLSLRDEALFSIIDAVRPQIPVIRVHTRAPITAPERVGPALVEGLRARAPVWVLVHCNHPRELTEPVRAALGLFVDAGVPVLNQAVLLRGVNDSVATLEELCSRLLELRVFPYYLHHTDAAAGNAHLRVSLEEGKALYAALSVRLSGLALPRYMIDPPEGTGKVPVSP